MSDLTDDFRRWAKQEAIPPGALGRAADEIDRLLGLLRSIACIAHDGGLIRASEWEALVAIRRLTLAHWDKTGTREEHKGRCAAAFGEADATADQPPADLTFISESSFLRLGAP